MCNLGSVCGSVHVAVPIDVTVLSAAGCTLPIHGMGTVILSVHAQKNYFGEVICIETHTCMHLCIWLMVFGVEI